jgi:hypothetical protein
MSSVDALKPDGDSAVAPGGSGAASSGTTWVSGALPFDPAVNPAVLDTATWDPAAAESVLRGVESEALESLSRALREGGALPNIPAVELYEGSRTAADSGQFVIAGLKDGQQVLLEIPREGAAPRLADPFGSIHAGNEGTVALQATTAANLHTFLREVAPGRGPLALGDTPRLGVGVRMTTACWPAVFRAMESGGFSTNAIQNSVRELNSLKDILERRPATSNYYTGFGMIESGHTGSTFEGLWVSGVLQALRHPTRYPFGADADHLQVKRGPDGLERARGYIDSCRYYTFYTMDMSDILDYAALDEPSDAQAGDRARAVVGDEAVLRSVLAYHRQTQPAEFRTRELSVPTLHRMISKYWMALGALESVNSYLAGIRAGEPYDLEFTIDEHPPERAAFDCLTSEEECAFVLGEVARRGVPVTHLAPNVGTEKGFDYRGIDGLVGLERRVASMVELAGARGVVIDIHSADDLTAPTRAAIRRATKGRLHYKVAPVPQVLFGEILEQVHPDVFADWWNDALLYAQESAETGSEFAVACIADLKAKASPSPSYRDRVFHHFCFRFVGRRGPDGNYLNRQRLYSLSDEFHRAYEDRLAGYLEGLAADLLT